MLKVPLSTTRRFTVGLAALALLLACGSPRAALADDLSLLLSNEQPQIAPAEPGGAPADVAPLQDTDLSLTLDPALLADEQPAAGAAAAPESKPAAPPQKGPPLPLHTTEGTGGALFVPFAYIVNPGPPGTIVSTPAASYTFVNIGGKFMNQTAITWALFRRIELGYCYGILGLGDWPQDVARHTGFDTGFSHIEMHTFSVRGVVIEEDSFHLPIPQITAGASFKYNPDIGQLNRNLNGAPETLGYRKNNSVDYTITASKTFPTLACGRPVIVSGGIRFSEAAQLGYLGFGDTYRMTGEGDICCLITDWWAVSYEYRQKKDPYGRMEPLVGKESDWQAICMAFILSPRMTFACGWGVFGQVVNHREDGVWGIQLKYEF